MKYELESKIVEDNVCVIYDNYLPDEVIAGGRIMIDIHNINQPIDCFVDSINQVRISKDGVEVHMLVRYQEINATSNNGVDNIIHFEKGKIKNDGIK